MRIVRPGSVVGPQQQYMYLKQLEWAKWAVADEMRKLQSQQQQTVTVTTTVVAPVTPPADIEEDAEMQSEVTETVIAIEPATPLPLPVPPVTPSRHIAAAAAKAKAIAPPRTTSKDAGSETSGVGFRSRRTGGERRPTRTGCSADTQDESEACICATGRFSRRSIGTEARPYHTILHGGCGCTPWRSFYVVG